MSDFSTPTISQGRDFQLEGLTTHPAHGRQARRLEAVDRAMRGEKKRARLPSTKVRDSVIAWMLSGKKNGSYESSPALARRTRGPRHSGFSYTKETFPPNIKAQAWIDPSRSSCAQQIARPEGHPRKSSSTTSPPHAISSSARGAGDPQKSEIRNAQPRGRWTTASCSSSPRRLCTPALLATTSTKATRPRGSRKHPDCHRALWKKRSPRREDPEWTRGLSFVETPDEKGLRRAARGNHLQRRQKKLQMRRIAVAKTQHPLGRESRFLSAANYIRKFQTLTEEVIAPGGKSKRLSGPRVQRLPQLDGGPEVGEN